jgi:hypothetical protein
VAILNYNHETIYHRTPWEIGAQTEVQPVISELLAPPRAKMVFQEQLLETYLRFDGSATERVAAIVEEMKGSSRMAENPKRAQLSRQSKRSR